MGTSFSLYPCPLQVSIIYCAEPSVDEIARPRSSEATLQFTPEYHITSLGGLSACCKALLTLSINMDYSLTVVKRVSAIARRRGCRLLPRRGHHCVATR